MATDFGTDFSTYPDLDWGAEISGPTVVLQAVARALEDGPKGLDLRAWLNANTDAAILSDLEQAILARSTSDERVASASASVVASGSDLRVEVEIVLVDEETPLRLVLLVTALGIEILKESAT